MRLHPALALAVAMVAASDVPAGRAQTAVGPIAYTHAASWQVPFTWEPYRPLDPSARQTDVAATRSRRLVPGVAEAPAYSPDGRRLALARERPRSALPRIFVSAAHGRGGRALTRPSDDFLDTTPTWSPDGTQIAFRREGVGILAVQADGGRTRRLTHDHRDHDPAWGTDGRIAFARPRGGYWRLHLIAPDDSGVTPLPGAGTHDEEPAWSPDGTRIAFAAESDDRTDIYTMRPDGTDRRRITAARPHEANRSPAWSPDGTQLAYSAWGPFGNDHEIMVVGAEGGRPRRLTDNRGDDLEPAWRPVPAAGAAALAVAGSGALGQKRRKPAGLRTWLRRPQTGNGSDCYGGRTFPLPDGPLVTFHTHRSSLEVFHGKRVEVGARGFLCAYRFSVSRTAPPIRIRLRRDDGVVKRLRLERGLERFKRYRVAYWVPQIGDKGNYVVTVRQGSDVARTDVRVVRAERPYLSLVHPYGKSHVTRRLGRPIEILVTGLPPRRRFALDLYRVTGHRQRPKYFNTVAARADRRGSRLYRLLTDRTDPPGSYWVALRIGRRQSLEETFTVKAAR